MHKRNSASKLDFSSCPETQLWVYRLVDYQALANTVLKIILTFPASYKQIKLFSSSILKLTQQQSQ
jgi:hypothetical protein